MGTSSSSLHELRGNKYLQIFSGKEPISPNDPFWNQFLSFTFVPPHSCADSRLLEDNISPMLDELFNTNPLTGHIAALIKVFLVHSSKLKTAVQSENEIFIWQARNSLFILRVILKYSIETAGEEGMLKQLEDGQHNKNNSGNASGSDKLLEELINALVEIIVDISLDNKTYAITVEAIHTLIVLHSENSLKSRSKYMPVLFSIFMKGKCTMHSYLLVKILMQHFYNQQKCPHCTVAEEGGNVIFTLASGIWNMLSITTNIQDPENTPILGTVLAYQSLLLLLLLTHHGTKEKETENPYRAALFSFSNSNNSDDALKDDIRAFKLDYEKLFNTMCNTLKDVPTALLIHLLLCQNPNFRQYIIVSSDISRLVVPLLKVLYNAPKEDTDLFHMALIILLPLSEKVYFNKKIHLIKLKNITWYVERALYEISLGSLVVLILSKVMYYLISKHDMHLYKNCLAALSNMSTFVQNLHPYVCHKFINLLEFIGKRYKQVSNQTKPVLHVDKESLSPKLIQSLSVLEEMLRMLLGILNSFFTSQLHSNINLLYTVLYKKEIFGMFRSNPNFQDIMQSIDFVLFFFISKLESMHQNLSVSEVYEILRAASQQWSIEK